MTDYNSIKAEVKEYFVLSEDRYFCIAKATTRSNEGDVVGHIMRSGYIAVVLPKLRKHVYAHHIVWFLNYGVWPPEIGRMIDHINGIRSDNSVNNLRLVNNSINVSNSNKPRGLLAERGVSAYPTNGGHRYRAQLVVGGQKYQRAGFTSAKEAKEWYNKRKKKLLPAL